MAAVLLLVAAMSAQNAPSTNKGRVLDIPAISREANGAIVSIVMSDKDGHPIAQGSGFLISKDGRVVTNYHVIRNGRSALVKLPNGTLFTVDGVLASDKLRDVAVIEAHGNDFRTVTLGDSDRLQVGEEVVAIGNPLSLESTVSNGIVSAIRTVEDEGGKFVQITAPISPGSSGGPLFNMAGQVVGITTSHLVGGQNLNFAIPINDVKPMLDLPLSKVARFPDEPEDAKRSSDVRPSEAGPDLDTTVNFMRRMVEPDGTSISYLDVVGGASASCDIAFAAQQDKDGKTHMAAIMSGIKPDKNGNDEPTYAVIQEFPYRKISLGDLDPSKVSTGEGFTATDKGELAITIVDFQDTDGSMKNFGFHIFLSKDRAERFMTAMKHAVTLCGGKVSPFAPAATQ